MSLTSLSSLSDEEYPTVSSRRNPPKLDAIAKFDENEFRLNFRLSKDTVIYISQLIGDKIKPLTRRNKAIQPIDQILITLRFFASGCYQKVVGDLFNVQQPTVHRIVHRVAAEIESLKDKYIYMPRAAEEQSEIVNKFYTIAGFPRVIGAIDCTHIKIASTGGSNAERYRNTKGYFSLNVQMVCDTNMIIRNIVYCPGSVYDRTVFSDSPLCKEFERGDFGKYYLLGDRDYPCMSYLLTPIIDPSSLSEKRYNQAHNSTRNSIERVQCVLKHRFPCLQIGLGVNIQKVPAILVACAVLHNIAIMRNEAALEDDDFNDASGLGESDFQNFVSANENVNVVRNSIIESHFS